MKKITGWHVAGMFLAGFSVIIGVNATLAVNAVRTFPGLETANSYVVSQQFDADRAAQTALDWDVAAVLHDGVLELSIAVDGTPVQADITDAIFGRATSVAVDQTPDFAFVDGVYRARVDAGPGNWNLRLTALAEDGTEFRQRVIVAVAQ